MIAIRVICGDGSEVRITKPYFEKMTLFDNPEIVRSRSYTLQCKASPQLVNLLLDRIDGDLEMKITDSNFDQLQSLCRELGFSGLDKELAEFERQSGANGTIGALEDRLDEHDVEIEEFHRQLCDMKNQAKQMNVLQETIASLAGTQVELRDILARHEDMFDALQRQRDEDMNEKRKTDLEMREFIARQFKSLERRIEETERVCDEQNVDISRKMKDSFNECAKRSDLEKLAEELAQLKEIEKETHVVEKQHPLTVTQPQLFVCDLSKPHMGIIAHLTFECGGNVYDKGIVNIRSNAGSHLGRVVTFDRDRYCRLEGRTNVWICYDFKDRRVIPTSYSMDIDDLKAWTVEVSNDGYLWTEIDYRDNNNFEYESQIKEQFVDALEYEPPRISVNFTISCVSRESFRFFRIRQTEVGHEVVKITFLEVFGILSTAEEIEWVGPLEGEFVYQAELETVVPPPLLSPKLEGIIAHLTRACGGNVHDKGIVDVTGNSLVHRIRGFGYGCQAENAADFESDSHVCLTVGAEWVCYDFKDRRVLPSSYSVGLPVTCDQVWRSRPLKSWVVEVSNDGYLWLEIDRQENISDLKDKFTICHFKISHVPSESFRFFRLRPTMPRDDNQGCTGLAALEVFGTLAMEEKHPESPQREFLYHAERESFTDPPPLCHPKLDGIIAHLTRECRGDLYRKGIVEVTDTGLGIIQIGMPHGYVRKERGLWICYDFKDRCVIPTSYSVVGSGVTCWIIEVSNDGWSWTEIDRQNDKSNIGVEGDCPVHFKVSNVPSESFRFFRLRKIGNVRLYIESLEVFGTLSMAKKTKQSSPEGEIDLTQKEEEFQVPPVFPPLRREFVYHAEKKSSTGTPSRSDPHGIITFLTGTCYLAVIEEQLYRDTDSECSDDMSVVDLRSLERYVCWNEPDSWICYKFKGLRVIPKSYSVSSFGFASYASSWVIEVSNDGCVWVEIDRRESEDIMRTKGRICHFEIERVLSESFRLFRLRQIARDYWGDNSLEIDSLEIFGTLCGK